MPLFKMPNAVPGAVVTRFPPEPSWHLDIGHCKAALMNELIAAQFQGRWILRFDDTNPKTCSAACVTSYMEDMPLLSLQPDRVSHASDYFGAMIASATQFITSGLLYADDTPVGEMRQQRLHKLSSSSRERTVADSLVAWGEMQAGSEAGQRFCLRFKLQPQSENGAMRDPVAFRVILEPHYKTGTQFKVYPTYDFAAPFLDLAEGVTHALRTLEFRDRDELYTLVQQAILQQHPEWRPTTIWEFPRIHMAFTPQAKSQQKALLAAGLLDGPYDPRLPTLRGLMRAGCHPDALRTFLLEQVTPARKETFHLWDKLWTFNRRLLDPAAARHMAVIDTGRVLVTVIDGPEQPQPTEVQWKGRHVVRVVRYKQIWIDQEDAQALTVGDEVVLMAWGNITITSVTRDHQQQQQQQQQDAVPAGADAGDAACFLSAPAAAAATCVSTQVSKGAAAAPAPTAAGPAAAGTAGQSEPQQQLFEGLHDVIALRDQLAMTQQRMCVTNSSCASTAGSTSLQQDPLEEQPPAAAAGPAAAAAAKDNQLQQQLPQGTPAASTSANSSSSSKDGAVVSMTALLHPSGDPKAATLKVHWLPALQDLLLPLLLVQYGHPIRTERVTEEVDVLAEFSHNSRSEALAWGDPSLLQSARLGTVVQLQRKGFFIIDDIILTSPAAAVDYTAAAAEEAAGSGVNVTVCDRSAGNASAGADSVGGSPQAAAARGYCATISSSSSSSGTLGEAGGGGSNVMQQGGSDVMQRAAGTLQLCDVKQLVMFLIPDGHTKHEAKPT